jgi:hypothetical protein
MPTSTLLASARQFARCAGTGAALSIVPLAAIELAPKASGQIIFNLPTALNSGGGYGGSGSSGGASGFFGAQLGGGGEIQGANVSIYNLASTNSGSEYLDFGDAGTGAGAVGSSATYSYNFTISATGSAVVTDWSVWANVDFGDAYSDNQLLGSGSGTGTFVGSGTIVASNLNPGDSPYAFMSVALDFTDTGISGTDAVSITMDSSGQGMSISNVTAVPEPTTYVLVSGLGALGLAGLRIRRRHGLIAA